MPFSPDELGGAIDLVAGWLTQDPQSVNQDQITVSEHRALETVIRLIDVASPECRTTHSLNTAARFPGIQGVDALT